MSVVWDRLGQWETIYDLDRDFTHMSTTQKHPVGKLCASLGQEKRKYAADKWCQTDRQTDWQIDGSKKCTCRLGA